MNKSDEFWFWAGKAIAEPENSSNIYYYDKGKDELFGLMIESDNYLPIFRNQITRKNIDINNSFRKAILKVKKVDPNVIQLPKLSFDVKKDFLNRVVSSIEDSSLKDKLFLEVTNFSKNDEFDFANKFKNENPELYFKYQMDRGIYISDRIKEIYEPLGLSINSKIIW